MCETDYQSLEQALADKDEILTSTSGISMYPMLRHRRDMIVVSRVNRKLKKHDVPLYRLPGGKLVLHRILKVTDNGYIIRGDNLFHKEYNITDDNIIGVLKAFYRSGRFVDCTASKGYKVYVFFNRVSYPLRWIIHCVKPPVWRVLSRIKHTIIK